MPTVIHGNFEWDEDKFKKNLEKHVIDFRDVVSVFGGEFSSETRYNQNWGEVRTMTRGKLDGEDVVIIHTMRGVRVRLISARRAHNDKG